MIKVTPSQIKKIIKIIRFCEKHYDAETFAHAMRVACISTTLSKPKINSLNFNSFVNRVAVAIHREKGVGSWLA